MSRKRDWSRVRKPRVSDDRIEHERRAAKLDTAATELLKRVPSPAAVDACKTRAGGWSRAQLAEWGISWPPPQGWKDRLRRRYFAQGLTVPFAQKDTAKALGARWDL